MPRFPMNPEMSITVWLASWRWVKGSHHMLRSYSSPIWSWKPKRETTPFLDTQLGLCKMREKILTEFIHQLSKTAPFDSPLAPTLKCLINYIRGPLRGRLSQKACFACFTEWFFKSINLRAFRWGVYLLGCHGPHHSLVHPWLFMHLNHFSDPCRLLCSQCGSESTPLTDGPTVYVLLIRVKENCLFWSVRWFCLRDTESSSVHEGLRVYCCSSLLPAHKGQC